MPYKYTIDILQNTCNISSFNFKELMGYSWFQEVDGMEISFSNPLLKNFENDF
jgi:hypothetical protein